MDNRSILAYAISSLLFILEKVYNSSNVNLRSGAMPRKSTVFLLTVFLIFITTTLFAGENRSKNNFGLYLSANEPAPALPITFHHFFDYMQVQATIQMPLIGLGMKWESQ
jgi:hypothetical protein